MHRHVRGGSKIWSAMEAGGIGAAEAWMVYESIGGSQSQAQLVAYVMNEEGWSRDEHNVLVLAINTLLRSHEADRRLAYLRKTSP